DDESTVSAAQDFVSEVSMLQDSADATRRQLHACLAKLESSAREAVDAASSRLGAAASRAASTIRDASAGGPTNPRNS
ncbi:MAG: hypothetical protein Q7U75_13235, partial [Desulfobacterales bacterium]|nr:hypothetical protein [Desulfobacterales bacterium]